MMYVFDIDGTICTKEKDYMKAVPYMNMINLINGLYDKGNIIKIITGRGGLSGINWKDKTKKQLKEWGLKYHQIKFIKKPPEYLYVDDMCCSPEIFIHQAKNRVYR